MKGIVKVILSFCFLLAAFFSFNKDSFYSFNQNTVHKTSSAEDIEGGHRWVEAKLQYEFEMLHDPATGEKTKGIIISLTPMIICQADLC